jgi:hypothetical protein
MVKLPDCYYCHNGAIGVKDHDDYCGCSGRTEEDWRARWERLLAYTMASVKIIILTRRHDMKGQPSNENSIQVPWFLVCIAHTMLKTAFLQNVTIACLYTLLLVSSILLLVRSRIVN